MSDPNQDATVGVLARRYSDARKARVGLIAAANAIRQSIDQLARKLATVDGFNPSSRSIPRMPADYPPDAHIAATLDELRSACEELELTHRLLKEAGVEI